nr:IS66 family transposase [Vibrio anguillarum]
MKKVPKTAKIPPTYEGLSHTQLVELLTQKDQLLIDKEQRLDDHNQVIQHQKEQLNEKTLRIELLEELLRLAKAQKFAASSEKFAYQIDLFDEVELEAAIDDLIDQLPDDVLPESVQPRKRQRGFSDKLTRVRVELRLSETEKAGATSTFFSKVKEELDIVPAKARV